MKILIYGSSGWIGSQFINIINENNIEWVNGISRCDDEVNLIHEIEQVNPTHVISFIGRTHGKIGEKIYSTIDYLEQKGKLSENLRDNLFSPILLASICISKHIHYTYLGTGCIFDGCGFDENSKPNFFGSSYSIVKGFTDRLMHLYDNFVLNLRIRMPITDTPNARNFITKITNYKKICSNLNSMTVLPELLPYVLQLMQIKYVGTLNFTNPGFISHNDILKMYKEIVDPTFTWTNFTIEEQRQILDSERSNNCLDTSKLETLFPNIENIFDAVKKSLVKYALKYNNETNLLVTGGCGFIGSNFINYYFNMPHSFTNIINLDALYYCANVNNINDNIRNNSHYIFIHGNLCDSKLVNELIIKHKITHVIHFAAQSHVQNSFEDSLQFTHDNVIGTHTLLEACRNYGKLQKFIHVSTDEVYGESINNVKTEQSILCPTNPYAATKAGAELIAQSYMHSYKMPIIITRGNNVYGLNQYPEKVIPKFINQLKLNQKITIQGKGTAVRAFLHVNDTIRAFKCILENGEIGEIYNIGCDSNMEYSVMEIATILIKKIKGDDAIVEDWIEYIEDRPFNDQRYFISNQKLKQLGWKIEIDFLRGLNDIL